MCGPFRDFEFSHVLPCTVACLPYLAMVLGLSGLYCSLAKERPWAEHLTSLLKRGVGTLLSVLHLTMKEHPVHSESMPSKQIIGQTVICTMDLSAPSNKRFWKC